MTRIGCIVMASGASRRFGSNKLMAELDGKPLIRHVIETAQAAGLDPIVVSVDDAFHAPVVSLCRQLGVRFALHTGTLQSDTVRCGMQEANVDAAAGKPWSGAVFLQGDQPLLRPASLRALLASFEAAPDKVSRLAWHKTPGSPVVFPAVLFDALRKVEGDTGGSGVFAVHPEYQASAVLVEAACVEELMDVDTPAELERLALATKTSVSISGLTTERLGVD